MPLYSFPSQSTRPMSLRSYGVTGRELPISSRKVCIASSSPNRKSQTTNAHGPICKTLLPYSTPTAALKTPTSSPAATPTRWCVWSMKNHPATFPAKSPRRAPKRAPPFRSTIENTGMTTMIDSRKKMLERVRAIVAKTIDNGCTESEAVAALAKAQELMAAYDISEAELGQTEETEAAVIHEDCE